MQCLGTQMCMSTAFHPQSDGQTERMNRLIQETLRHFVCYTQRDWADHLQLATFAINNSKSASTGETPFFLNYGRHPKHPSGVSSLPSATELAPSGLDFCTSVQDALAEAKRCLASAQTRQKKSSDAHRREAQFQVGAKHG